MKVCASDTCLTTGVEWAASTGRTVNENEFRNLMNQAAAGSGPELDSITFRSGSGLLTHAALLMPTLQNVQRLSAAVGIDLAAAFREAGIPTQPPIEIRVDEVNGRIRVSAERPDAVQIEDKLNSDSELAEAIRTTIAISSHAQGMQSSLAFQREYLDSGSPDAVVAKYSPLFSAPQNRAISLRFEGTQIEVLTD